MLYGTHVIHINMDVHNDYLQFPARSPYVQTNRSRKYRETEEFIIINIEKTVDVLPLLTNRYILERMMMKSMGPVVDASVCRLILATHLYACTIINRQHSSEEFCRVYLREIRLNTCVVRILRHDSFPGCNFLKDN
jgi:hypothetical protein